MEKTKKIPIVGKVTNIFLKDIPYTVLIKKSDNMNEVTATLSSGEHIQEINGKVRIFVLNNKLVTEGVSQKGKKEYKGFLVLTLMVPNTIMNFEGRDLYKIKTGSGCVFEKISIDGFCEHAEFFGCLSLGNSVFLHKNFHGDMVIQTGIASSDLSVFAGGSGKMNLGKINVKQDINIHAIDGVKIRGSLVLGSENVSVILTGLAELSFSRFNNKVGFKKAKIALEDFAKIPSFEADIKELDVTLNGSGSMIMAGDVLFGILKGKGTGDLDCLPGNIINIRKLRKLSKA